MGADVSLRCAVLLHESRVGWQQQFHGSRLHRDYARALASDDEVTMLRGLLEESGLETSVHDLCVADRSCFKQFLDSDRRDFIFWNVSDGEDFFIGGLVPAICRVFGWPYFGSSAYTQALCQNKDHWKSLLAAKGVATPRWDAFNAVHGLTRDDVLLRRLAAVPVPHFVKAANLGNSAGFSDIDPISKSPEETVEKIKMLVSNGIGSVVVEEFVPGPEFTVGAAHFEDWETVSFHQIYSGDYIDQATKDRNLGRELRQERLADARLDALAREIIALLRMKDYCRIDFRMGKAGTYCAIDVNSAPFMTGSTFTSLSESRCQSRSDFFRSLLTASFQRQREPDQDTVIPAISIEKS